VQLPLKKRCSRPISRDGGNPSDHAQLAQIAESVGLDRQRAEAILASDEFADEVREEEQLWLQRGVSSVPTVVFNGQYAVTGDNRWTPLSERSGRS
jgi:predicted DsbA family dithiol-disulfide isomerase